MAVPYSPNRVYEPRETRDPRVTGRLSDLMRRRGDIAADRILRNAEISGRMWQNVGQTIGDTVARVADIPRQRAADKAAEVATLKSNAAKAYERADSLEQQADMMSATGTYGN